MRTHVRCRSDGSRRALDVKRQAVPDLLVLQQRVRTRLENWTTQRVHERGLECVTRETAANSRAASAGAFQIAGTFNTGPRSMIQGDVSWVECELVRVGVAGGHLPRHSSYMNVRQCLSGRAEGSDRTHHACRERHHRERDDHGDRGPHKVPSRCSLHSFERSHESTRYATATAQTFETGPAHGTAQLRCCGVAW